RPCHPCPRPGHAGREAGLDRSPACPTSGGGTTKEDVHSIARVTGDGHRFPIGSVAGKLGPGLLDVVTKLYRTNANFAHLHPFHDGGNFWSPKVQRTVRKETVIRSLSQIAELANTPGVALPRFAQGVPVIGKTIVARSVAE